MRSSRWHALGNTYLLVGPDEPRLTPDVARELSRDSDGVVEVLEASADTAVVVIWNQDGSTAELSGNGTRIAARWLAERSGAEEVRIRVGTREVSARMLDDRQVETAIGSVVVGPTEEVEGVLLRRVSVANPHAVVEADPAEIVELGPLLVAHAAFPGGTNVEVARVERAGEVLARVWERGVGETTASGTGAVAVAAATHGEGDVLVLFPGGAQRVRLASGDAYLTGPAEPV
jgi:diaminopimelate epimerase